MSVAAVSRPPLEVGAIIADAFSIFFGRFWLMLALALVPALLTQLVPVLLIVPLALDGGANNTAAFVIVAVVVFLIVVIGLFLSAALIVLAAFDARLNRPLRVGTYIRLVLTNLPAIVILSIVAGLLIAGGFALLIVPGLWLAAVFFVVVPAIVIERAGFGGLGRSASLTKDYRWPIVGVFIVLAIINALAEGLFVELPRAMFELGEESWLPLVIETVASAVTNGIGATATAMTYARLREIKEGVSVGSLADIFA